MAEDNNEQVTPGTMLVGGVLCLLVGAFLTLGVILEDLWYLIPLPLVFFFLAVNSFIQMIRLMRRRPPAGTETGLHDAQEKDAAQDSLQEKEEGAYDIAKIDIKEQDPRTYNIVEYMLWSFRVICYCINFNIFSALGQGIRTGRLSPFIYDLALWIYSIACFAMVEWFFRRVYNPSYKRFKLTQTERIYKLEGERIIFSSICFCIINIFLVVPVAIFFEIDMNPFHWFLGPFLGMISGFFNLIGVLFLLAKNTKTGEPMGSLRRIGGILLLVPLGFVLYTIYFFLKSI
jgi:hypothetical protein